MVESAHKFKSAKSVIFSDCPPNESGIRRGPVRGENHTLREARPTDIAMSEAAAARKARRSDTKRVNRSSCVCLGEEKI